MDAYIKGEAVGSGTYGTVYKGHVKDTGKMVAIKKINLGPSKDGVQFSAIREIKALQELRHDNVLDLIDVFSHNQNIHLIVGFMEWDLEMVIKSRSLILRLADIKAYMQMLLRGLEHCHQNWVLHRDLKPSNLLLGANGVLKIADFGLARPFGSPDRLLTHQVITRWYRPPELLYGARQYGYAVDMWSVGCIFAELMLRNPYFPGDSDLDQLGKIFAALGTPTDDIWPGMSSLPDYVPFHHFPPTPYKALFSAAPDDALDLLSLLLSYDPQKRPSATEALNHPYFSNSPAPTPTADLPKPPPRAKAPPPPEEGSASKRSRVTEDMEASGVRRKIDMNLFAS
eukprot:TRINITY_DN6497_c0_g1_i1.p1 TRINITY_DN6497_c0_g1~~TRINITY_DN6497_c0_g1_i1.p1  ORF type:complete len:341 (+),score=42.17 TRINITY_DN6497_c0_g1_i1:25-1047(+)